MMVIAKASNATIAVRLFLSRGAEPPGRGPLGWGGMGPHWG